MLKSFPDWEKRTEDDKKFVVLTFEDGCAEFPSEAVVQSARRFRNGDVSKQSKTRAPTLAEFRDECHVRVSYLELKNKPAPRTLAIPNFNNMTPAEWRLEKLRTEMEGRGLHLVASNIALDAFKTIVARNITPPGTQWQMGQIWSPTAVKIPGEYFSEENQHTRITTEMWDRANPQRGKLFPDYTTADFRADQAKIGE